MCLRTRLCRWLRIHESNYVFVCRMKLVHAILLSFAAYMALMPQQVVASSVEDAKALDDLFDTLLNGEEDESIRNLRRGNRGGGFFGGGSSTNITCADDAEVIECGVVGRRRRRRRTQTGKIGCVTRDNTESTVCLPDPLPDRFGGDTPNYTCGCCEGTCNYITCGCTCALPQRRGDTSEPELGVYMMRTGSDRMKCVPNATSITLQVMDYGDDAFSVECVTECPAADP